MALISINQLTVRQIFIKLSKYPVMSEQVKSYYA